MEAGVPNENKRPRGCLATAWKNENSGEKFQKRPELKVSG
jgi:hypothetical protein